MRPYLRYACERLRAFLTEAKRLEQSEFPYAHSKSVLELIHREFASILSELSSFTEKSDDGTVKQACAISLYKLFAYLPLLGFILRLTNVRNTFEVFGPVLELVRDVLDGKDPNARKTSLVISSEWDYSPLMYDQIQHLPDFVFIGFPACESANPLILPLAGHELGHSVWAKQGLESKLKPIIAHSVVEKILANWDEYLSAFHLPDTTPKTDIADDLFLINTWEPIVSMCLCQAQESFCDFVGLRIFRESYLHAFAYLLSPTHGGSRSVEYPSMTARVKNLIKTATSYGVNCPGGYSEVFDDELEPPELTETERFCLSVADQSLDAIIDKIIIESDNALPTSVLPSEVEVGRIYSRFRLVVPAEDCKCLADILNAGWKAFLDDSLWKDAPNIQRRKDSIVKELILKTIEVFEIENTPL